MLSLIFHAIGIILLFVSLILQRSIINLQAEIIEEQNSEISKLNRTLKIKTMLYRMRGYALGIRKDKEKEK